MSMRNTILFTLALSACMRPEEGINDSRVRGDVVLAPHEVEEYDERQNGALAGAVDLEELNYGVQIITGVVRDYSEGTDSGSGPPTPPPEPDTGASTDTGTSTDTGAGTDTETSSDTESSDTESSDTESSDTESSDTESSDTDSGDTAVPAPTYDEPLNDTADKDWYTFTVPEDVTMTFEVTFDGAEDTLIRFGLYDADGEADEDGVYTAIESWDLSVMDYDTAAGSITMDVELTAGTNYGMRVAGLYGTQDETLMPYTIKMYGLDPNNAGLKVTAHAALDDGSAPDIADRGNPVGGGEAHDFVLQSDDTYVGTYEIFLVREVVTTVETGDTAVSSTTVVDEEIPGMYVWAGNWSNINQDLPAGTWYSSEPVYVDLSAETTTDTADEWGYAYIPADDITVDSIAPLVVGFIYKDTEPNDVEVDDSLYLVMETADAAQDVGTISVPGFVDYFTGTIDFESDASGFVHDNDAYKFTVDVATTLNFEMDWESDGDLDILLYDSTGAYIDYAASTAQPEIGLGINQLEPGETYYLVVLGYADAIGSTPYEVTVEPIAN